MQGDRRETTRIVHNFLKACWIDRWVTPKSHVLDLGCGHGGDLLKFRHRDVASYTGMDQSKMSIYCAISRSRCFPQKVGVRFRCQRFGDTPWALPQYDVVVSNFALHYAFEGGATAMACMESIRQCLKPNGRLIGILSLCKGRCQANDDPTGPIVTWDEFVKTAARAGLVLENWMSDEDAFKEFQQHEYLSRKMNVQTLKYSSSQPCVLFQFRLKSAHREFLSRSV